MLRKISRLRLETTIGTQSRHGRRPPRRQPGRFASRSQEQHRAKTMYEDVIDLLKPHDYFRGISGAVLGKLPAWRRSQTTNLPRSSTSLTIRSRQSASYSGSATAVRVDSRGDEYLFQIFERGDQYGTTLGGPLRPRPHRYGQTVCRLGKALPRDRTFPRGRQSCVLLAMPQG